MVANLKQHRLISPEEYLELERKAEFKSEYYDGVIYDMAGGTEAHNLIVANVVIELGPQLKGNSCKLYPSDMKVRSSSRRFHYPDVSVVCGDVKFHDGKKDIYTNPVLIIEVLSPSTSGYDRGIKFHSYQNIKSLKEYVLISQDEPLVEKYVRRSDGNWLYSKIEGLESGVEFSSINCRVSLTDIYAKVDLTDK